jgi:hypothetical protein
MNDDDFDNAMQDAVLRVHDAWTDNGGRALTPEELQSLNALLTGFFAYKQW